MRSKDAPTPSDEVVISAISSLTRISKAQSLPDRRGERALACATLKHMTDRQAGLTRKAALLGGLSREYLYVSGLEWEDADKLAKILSQVTREE